MAVASQTSESINASRMVKFAFVWKSASTGNPEFLDSTEEDFLYSRIGAVASSPRVNFLRISLIVVIVFQVYFVGVHVTSAVEGEASNISVQKIEEERLFAPTSESFSIHDAFTKNAVTVASILERSMVTTEMKSTNETSSTVSDFFESDFLSPTLALVDPIFMGGFRNQHMRFVALADHARKRNIPSLLLPSLQWGNNAIQMKDKQKQRKSVSVVTRVPHSYLFDVDHWNQLAWEWKEERARRAGEEPENHGFEFQTRSTPKTLEGAVSTFDSPPMLPFLVPYNPRLHSDWDNINQIFQDLAPEKVLDPKFNPRRMDLMELTVGNSMPFAFGSGKGAGRLWNEYYQTLIKEEILDPAFDGSTASNTTPFPTIEMEHRGALEIAIYQALKPSVRLQPVVDSILYKEDYRNNTRKHSKHDFVDSNTPIPSLIVIHPRCEIDMLMHKCGKKMTRNLTKIFEMVEESPHFSNLNSDTGTGEPLYERVMLCVARDLMAPGSMSTKDDINTLVEQNWVTLNRVTRKNSSNFLKEDSLHGLWKGKVQVIEAGEDAAASIPDLPSEAVEIVAQVINFFVAVNAAVFVGTFGSSYSTDVWTVRYHLGKGSGNFYHSPQGIHKVSNGGLPGAHRCK